MAMANPSRNCQHRIGGSTGIVDTDTNVIRQMLTENKLGQWSWGSLIVKGVPQHFSIPNNKLGQWDIMLIYLYRRHTSYIAYIPCSLICRAETLLQHLCVKRRREWNSSLKGLPKTDSPPVPVPVASPPCKM
ncbi:MAG: hypothetical protein FRX49_08573 [Trebouxia sp. A1-2]|nr:MAG: hypothetical protein FRX49_08573 [Trebouxia sp. A1-2]